MPKIDEKGFEEKIKRMEPSEAYKVIKRRPETRNSLLMYVNEFYGAGGFRSNRIRTMRGRVKIKEIVIRSFHNPHDVTSYLIITPITPTAVILYKMKWEIESNGSEDDVGSWKMHYTFSNGKWKNAMGKVITKPLIYPLYV